MTHSSADTPTPSSADSTRPLGGLHHITAIASDPRANLDFYTRVLGQRLVKKTVNFDDPNTYHLYYGSRAGDPGTILTFFPWPGARRGQAGVGQATRFSYAVPEGSLGYWRDRLRRLAVTLEERSTAGAKEAPALVLLDPDGMQIELFEDDDLAIVGEERWTGHPEDPVDAEHAIGAFGGVTLTEREGSGTARFLQEVMAGREVTDGAGNATERFELGAVRPTVVDIQRSGQLARGGAGTIHHIAFRVADDPSELAWQRMLAEKGVGVSPVMDRQYFHSIYFREPGGVLFEIATDPPGFALDEPLESLGEDLKLPPRYEAHRSRIEAALPPLPPLPGLAGLAASPR